MTLPDFISPMLAKIGEPFSAPDYQFEIKWDGMRALAFVENGDYRLINRRRNVVKDRYPEFDSLRTLPDGTVLDGEIVLLKDGRPDFPSMLSREQARGPLRIRQLARDMPANYAAFDLLYLRGASIMDWPLKERRAALADVLDQARPDRIFYSEGVEEVGEAYFTQAVEVGLEGIVAKRLASKYQPGRRSDAWIKIKRAETIYCVIIGYLPEGTANVRSLLIATEVDGELVSVGRVGSGLDVATRAQLRPLLEPRARRSPVLPLRMDEAVWVEPEVFCVVKYLERTNAGELRAPVFMGLVDAPAHQ